MPSLDIAALFVVLLLAALLRFDRLDLAQFKNDEARALSLATQIVRGESFPLVGIPSSAGLQNGPALPYLLAVPLLVRKDVLFTTGFVAALNVAALALTYALVRRHFGGLAAFVGVLLFAVGFWPVTFSRFIWAQNTLPFFTALFGLALFEAVNGQRRWCFAAAAALVGLMAQLHFSSLAFVPLLVLVGALFYRRLGSAALAAIPVFFAAVAPYFLGELFRSGENLRGISDVAGGTFALRTEALVEPLRLLGSDSYDRWLGEGGQTLRHAASVAVWPSRLVAGLALLGLVRAIWSGVRLPLSPLVLRQAQDERGTEPLQPAEEERVLSHLLLGLWAVVPIATLLYTPFPVYEHYFILLLPALFALVGVGADELLRAARTFGAARSWRWTAIATMVLFAALAWIVVTQVAFNRVALEAQEGEARLIGRGIPLGDLRAVVNLLAATHSADRWIVAREDVREPLRALANIATHSQTLTSQTLVAGESPRQAYLMVEGSGKDGDFLEQNMAAFLVERRETPSPAAVFRLYVVPKEAMLAAVQEGRAIQRVTTAGVELLSIDFDRNAQAGAPLSVRLTWQVQDAQASVRASYRFFAHLVRDPSASPLAQEDGIGYPSERWRTGDFALTWLDVAIPASLPAGDYTLRVGMYDLESGALAPFRAEDAQPESDWLLFGPVHIGHS